MFRKISSFLTFAAFITFFLLCFAVSGSIASGISKGITLCATILIPSLFLFLVLSDLLEPMLRGRKIPKPLRLFSEYVLHIDGRLLYLFILGMLGGYPIGAKLIADETERNHISDDDARYLLRFCICGSPAFLISNVARVLWNDVRLGLILYAVQVFAGILIAFFTGKRHFVNYCTVAGQHRKEAFSVLLVRSAQRSTRQMGMICGFVLLFCGFFSVIELIPLDALSMLLLKGFAEVTIGCQSVASLPAFYQPIAVAAFTSFAGVCVHLQIMALCGKVKLRYGEFLKFRLLYTFIATALTALLGFLFPPVMNCFSQGAAIPIVPTEQNLFSSFLLLFLCCMLLLLFDNKKKPRTESQPFSL